MPCELTVALVEHQNISTTLPTFISSKTNMQKENGKYISS